MIKTKLCTRLTFLFLLGFNLMSLDLSAQLKSDLVISPHTHLISQKMNPMDSVSLFNPVLFTNTDYLLPTAFFCKLELGLDKKSFMPVRFRLGSLDYVNYLEGKDESGKVEFGIE